MCFRNVNKSFGKTSKLEFRSYNQLAQQYTKNSNRGIFYGDIIHYFLRILSVMIGKNENDFYKLSFSINFGSNNT